MGQKTNPISLRLNIDRHFDSCWYPAQSSQYGQYIHKDLNIREYLKSLFASLGLHTGRINIQMFPKKLQIHYFFHQDSSRVSQRRRFQNMQTSSSSSTHKLQSEFSGLSFLRSIREKQKLSSRVVSGSQSSLTFREALALQRQKISEFDLQETSHLDSSLFKKNLSSESLKMFSREHELKNLKDLKTSNLLRVPFKFSPSSKKSGEAGKLFIFKGLSTLKPFQNIFQNILDPQKILLKNQLKIESPKNGKIKSFQDLETMKTLLLKGLLKDESFKPFLNDSFQSFEITSPESFQKLAKLFFQKSHKISENLSNFESLCRLVSLPQPFFKTNFKIQKLLNLEKAHSKFQEILPEYKTLFNGPIFHQNFAKESLWYTMHKKRASFFKEENLKHIEEIIGKHLGNETILVPLKIKSRTRSAHFLCQTVIQQFQKNFSFRQIYKNLFKDIQADPSVQGIRFVCSGRFGGIEMARVESRKYGQTSLHVFSSHIDYAQGHALTSSGLLGVKIWISYRPDHSKVRTLTK